MTDTTAVIGFHVCRSGSRGCGRDGCGRPLCELCGDHADDYARHRDLDGADR